MIMIMATIASSGLLRLSRRSTNSLLPTTVGNTVLRSPLEVLKPRLLARAVLRAALQAAHLVVLRVALPGVKARLEVPAVLLTVRHRDPRPLLTAHLKDPRLVDLLTTARMCRPEMPRELLRTDRGVLPGVKAHLEVPVVLLRAYHTGTPRHPVAREVLLEGSAVPIITKFFNAQAVPEVVLHWDDLGGYSGFFLQVWK